MSGEEAVSFSLSFPAQAEYLVLCRLAVAALAGRRRSTTSSSTT